MLRPHEREHGQLHVARLATEAGENQVVLVVGESELAVSVPPILGAGGLHLLVLRSQATHARSATAASIDSKIESPSVEPVRGSTACSGCGIRPKTLPALLTTPAMSSWEPLGLWPLEYLNTTW